MFAAVSPIAAPDARSGGFFRRRRPPSGGPRGRDLAVTVLLAAFVTLAPTACSDSIAAATAPASGEASLFTVPPNQRARLRVITVQPRKVVRTLSIPAVVSFDDLKTSTVMPLVSGKVERVLVHEGDHVRAGQVLLILASPDSSDTAANLERDQATLQNKQAVLVRDQDLYSHLALSLQDLQAAQLDVATAKAQLQDDEAHVEITGTGLTHAELRAPIGGLVVSRQVSPGDAVSAGTTSCFVITDPTVVWVVGHLYQEDLTRVQVGDPAEIHSPILQAPLDGPVAYIGASIDPDTLTVPVRIAVSNPGGLLKAGMYVEADIQPTKQERALVVPTASVLRDDDNMPFVYVQAAPGTFARRHVQLGDQVGDGYVIEQGLAPGDAVLANGAVFVQFAQDLER